MIINNSTITREEGKKIRKEIERKNFKLFYPLSREITKFYKNLLKDPNIDVTDLVDIKKCIHTHCDYLEWLFRDEIWGKDEIDNEV